MLSVASVWTLCVFLSLFRNSWLVFCVLHGYTRYVNVNLIYPSVFLLTFTELFSCEQAKFIVTYVMCNVSFLSWMAYFSP